jgi:O-antigen ligase
MAGSILLFLAFFLARPSFAKATLIGLCTIFLIQTESKTSMILVAAVASVLLLYFVWQQFKLLRTLILAMLISIVLAGIALIDIEAVKTYVISPMAFTGRAQVWRAVLNYVADHWALGAGFASFWGIGPNSPILRYAESWAAYTGNGHNGYLDMLAATGVVGFVLTVWAFVVWPAVATWRAWNVQQDLALIAGPLFAFSALHNLLETSIMSFVPGAWSFWVIATAIVLPLQHTSDVQPTAGGT